MGWTVVVDVDGLYQKMDTLANSAADLEKPLGVFGGYLLQRSRERYKAQNFAPLAESTIEKRAQKGMRSLERKLEGDVTKAQRRARKSREREPQGLVERLLTRSTSLVTEDVLSAQTRGVQNRLAVLKEFQSHHRVDLKSRVEGKALSLKAQMGLAQREARAVMRQVGRPILGGLDRTLMFVVGHGSVTLRSRTHQEWSEAHNEGATVGHGAQDPARPTVFVEERDINVLISILKAHLLLPFAKGMHGPAF